MSVARKVGSKYMELGIALGLEAETVSSVAGQGEHSHHMRAFYVLLEWTRAAENLTFATLRDALEEAGLRTCAHETCYVSSDADDL